MAILNKPKLLDMVLQGLRDSGWTPVVVDSTHPFLVRAASPNHNSFSLRIYIWNCTHGGNNRAHDEFRIQFTGVVPHANPQEITVLLGWYDTTKVFAAWDIYAHNNQNSLSPSAQIRAITLNLAAVKSFATQIKDNEIVVAFRPNYLADYALSKDSIHTNIPQKDLSILNNLDTVNDYEIDAVADTTRRLIIRKIVTKYRSAAFRDNVLAAYNNMCAFCGVQLSLIDAAHIIPVASPESTDKVSNGIALCKIHHFAYDANLLSFNENYAIEISNYRVSYLNSIIRIGGLKEFQSSLRSHIMLPDNTINYPNKYYI